MTLSARLSILIQICSISWWPTPSTLAACHRQKYKLVNVSLWTQSALVFSLAYHWDLLQQNGHFPSKENVEEE
ncbi:hypothetical protein C2S51_038939 [Perilla frutescens var. frutescens]|nr:hypothetical protein C2S51_038939 [Perilla frutescens var. frutescens]